MTNKNKNKKSKKSNRNKFGNPAMRSERPSLHAAAHALLDHLGFAACCDRHAHLAVLAAEEAIGFGCAVVCVLDEPVWFLGVDLGDTELAVDIDLLSSIDTARVAVPLLAVPRIVDFIESSNDKALALDTVFAMLEATFEKFGAAEQSAA